MLINIFFTGFTQTRDFCVYKHFLQAYISFVSQWVSLISTTMPIWLNPVRKLPLQEMHVLPMISLTILCIRGLLKLVASEDIFSLYFSTFQYFSHFLHWLNGNSLLSLVFKMLSRHWLDDLVDQLNSEFENHFIGTLIRAKSTSVLEKYSRQNFINLRRRWCRRCRCGSYSQRNYFWSKLGIRETLIIRRRLSFFSQLKRPSNKVDLIPD